MTATLLARRHPTREWQSGSSGSRGRPAKISSLVSKHLHAPNNVDRVEFRQHTIKRGAEERCRRRPLPAVSFEEQGGLNMPVYTD